MSDSWKTGPSQYIVAYCDGQVFYESDVKSSKIRKSEIIRINDIVLKIEWSY